MGKCPGSPIVVMNFNPACPVPQASRTSKGSPVNVRRVCTPLLTIKNLSNLKRNMILSLFLCVYDPVQDKGDSIFFKTVTYYIRRHYYTYITTCRYTYDPLLHIPASNKHIKTTEIKISRQCAYTWAGENIEGGEEAVALNMTMHKEYKIKISMEIVNWQWS